MQKHVLGSCFIFLCLNNILNIFVVIYYFYICWMFVMTSLACINFFRSPTGGARSAAFSAEEQHVSERGTACWALHRHGWLQGVTGSGSTVCQTRRLRHCSRCHLGWYRCAARHSRGTHYGHLGTISTKFNMFENALHHNWWWIKKQPDILF